MVKARTWFTLFIMSLATVAATASCGSSDEGTGGGSGGSILGGGGASGNAGKAGSVGRAGSSGNGTGGGVGSSTTLGAPCTADAQCDSGQTCLTATSTTLGGGGPAHGMCTLACTSTDECSAVEAGSDCFNFGTMAAPVLYCLKACTQGGTDQATAETKCQGRPDFACVDFSDTGATVPQPFCIPLCRADLDCGAAGSGLYCNKGSGLCTKTKPPAGDPSGTACTPGAATPTCEGACLRTSDDGVMPVTGTCVELCSGLNGCAYDGEQAGGLCYGQLIADAGFYDLGFCLPSCTCTGDCTFPGTQCRAWTAAEATISEGLLQPGLCFGNLDGSSELTTCAEGGASGAGGEPGTAGTGGSTAGTGGSTAGTGGSTAGTGGSTAGTGG